MVLVDIWTIVHFVLFVIGVVSATRVFKRRKDTEDEDSSSKDIGARLRAKPNSGYFMK
jgi:hypothetical protein